MNDSQPAAMESGAPNLSMRTLLDAANLLTLFGLVCALCSAFLAIQAQIAFAIVALMFSGICDLFDGVLARRIDRNEKQKQFGGSLDSLVDTCSFGFAPAILVLSSGSNSIGEQIGLVFFVGCVVWRLAYFDTTGLSTSGSRRYFTGLPVTYVSFFLPIAYLGGFANAFWMRAIVDATLLLLGFAMVSKIPIPKPSGIFYLLFPLIGIALISIYSINAEQFLQ